MDDAELATSRDECGRRLRGALEALASARAERDAARQCARVLAHAWDRDARPPDWSLELARQWDAYGKEIAS